MNPVILPLNIYKITMQIIISSLKYCLLNNSTLHSKSLQIQEGHSVSSVAIFVTVNRLWTCYSGILYVHFPETGIV